MTDQKLREYFEFDEADLYANRNGQLSQKQLNRLKTNEGDAKKNTRVVVIVVFVIAAIGLALGLLLTFSAFSSGGQGLSGSVGGISTGIFSGALFGVVWAYIWVRIGLGLLKSSSSTKTYKLDTVRRKVEIVAYEDPDTEPYYELRIGELTFDLDAEVRNAIVDGGEYLVYYIEDMDAIISLELAPQTK